jgi:hypothetical protein
MCQANLGGILDLIGRSTSAFDLANRIGMQTALLGEFLLAQPFFSTERSDATAEMCHISIKSICDKKSTKMLISINIFPHF